MIRRGDCWDNAPTESLWGSLKVGRLHGRRFATRREAMDEVIDWLTFYNHSRLRSALNYMCPMQFEQRWLGSKKVSIITHAMDSINSGQGQYFNY